MQIRLFSDLHAEGQDFYIEHIPGDEERVCILAGDIGMLVKPLTWRPVIEEACDLFKHVIWVFGNHEWYKGVMPWGSNTERSTEHVLAPFKNRSNLTLGTRIDTTVDGVRFIGDTMWTSLDNGRHDIMRLAQQRMNDYYLIFRCQEENELIQVLTPEDTRSLFLDATDNFLWPELEATMVTKQKTVVVTHHLPSWLSVPAVYATDPLSYAYASLLDEQIRKYSPALWVHGHTHTAQDYNIEDTRIVCNPRGYRGEQTGFNKQLIIEV